VKGVVIVLGPEDNCDQLQLMQVSLICAALSNKIQLTVRIYVMPGPLRFRAASSSSSSSVVLLVLLLLEFLFVDQHDSTFLDGIVSLLRVIRNRAMCATVQRQTTRCPADLLLRESFKRASRSGGVCNRNQMIYIEPQHNRGVRYAHWSSLDFNAGQLKKL